MAKESFDDEETAKLMNERFVNVKLDRDERPDVDRRYQQSVAAMGGGSGWPLSVFLTPDRKPFFGGTYFPPEDRQGRPGFKNVLRTVSGYYQTQRDAAEEYAARVVGALQPEALRGGELDPSLIDSAQGIMLSQFDPEHGGFGAMPKFPMPGAVEFLLHRNVSTGDPSTGEAVRKTLDAMANGGFHDQLGGGFHRYSVDEAWVVPHFEKMADDNAWLLRNFVHAYGVFGEERYRSVALGIIRFLRDVLSDPAGGFYASQDADVTPDDEGGYFTWTEGDFRRVLTADEYAVLSLHLLHERGAMHHDDSKHVLFIVTAPEDIARRLGRSMENVVSLIDQGKKKLLSERDRRKAPYLDTALYTSLNGMLIASCLRAFRVLRDRWCRDFALLSLGRILRERMVNGELMHAETVPAVLDDYIFLIDALVEAYETTADRSRLEMARTFMDQCLEKFYDRSEGGFFDTSGEVLGLRLKRVEDVPHPSANAVGILLLLRLAALMGNGVYEKRAVETLRIFAPSAGEMGVHAGMFFAALHASFSLVTLTVESPQESELAAAARGIVGPYTALVYGEDHGRVIPCVNGACHEPVVSAGMLRDVTKEIAQRGGRR
jgi:uncharacterized protein YyaL (SSP411 family)